MAIVKVLDPVTRIEGHLKIEVSIDTVGGVQQVVDAHATGTLFRGFEQILANRPPLDAPHITQRICGVCPVSHGLASVMALEMAAGVTPPENARILRNLVLGANFVQSHILHFYHLALLDFIEGPERPPWQPGMTGDKRLGEADTAALIGSYLQALDMRRKAHEMGALFGGRLPHPPAYVPGGFTGTPRMERVLAFQAYLGELIPFIENVWWPDLEKVSTAYDDYYDIGAGWGNLLAFGVFDLDAAGTAKLLGRGRMVAGSGTVLPLNLGAITEQVTHSWYSDSTNNLRPTAGRTLPQYPKANAYSWLKAPRYANAPYEVGPLARMWVNGDYHRGISVMDRHWARSHETWKVAQAMTGWLQEIDPAAPTYTRYRVPTTGRGYGLTEAPRGALAHALDIVDKKLGRYQVVTPTCWNASPRDTQHQLGPIEKALVGTPIADPAQPIEVVRVIHSFDPCLSCAVHVMRPGEKSEIVTLAQSREPRGASCLEEDALTCESHAEA